jgi:hypothetical protein
MELKQHITRISPLRFIEEDLKSARAKARFLDRSHAAQVAKLVTFFLGHNSDYFAAEPVYGPTGKAALKSRGVEGLRHDAEILDYLKSQEGESFISKFLKQVIDSIRLD